MTRPRAALQTYHALQASDLAATFDEALKKLRIAPGDYRVELKAPEGPSTAGGLQAMQHLRLVPRTNDFPTLVVGHANHAAGLAELRTFEHVDALHRQRYHRPVVLGGAQYEQFLVLAKQVLSVLRLQVSLVGPPAELGRAKRTASWTASSPWVFAIAAFGVFALAGLGYWLVR